MYVWNLPDRKHSRLTGVNLILRLFRCVSGGDVDLHEDHPEHQDQDQ